MNRIILRMTTLCVVALSLSACAGNMAQLPDGTVLAQATVGDTLDRSASYTGRYRVVGNNPDGSPMYQEIAGDLTVGPTVGGQVLAAAIPGIAVAATNGIAGAAIARQNACRSEQGCGNTNIMVDGAEALAVSESQSAADVDFDANISNGGCATCAILD